MQMSERIRNFPVSPIRRLVPHAAAAKKRGVHVYHLNIGQPDIPTPEEVRDFSWNGDHIAYGPSQGNQDLLEALPDYYKKYNIDLSSDDILITTGGSEAIQFAFLTLCDPGDEIIVPEPFYANVSSFAATARVTLVPATSSLDREFALPTVAEFERRITDKTRAILICSPNNPTGYIYSEEELLTLCEVCRKHDIFLMADEVYREFCYDGRTFVSSLTLTDYSDRIICLDSFSKRYSMCGIRVGALISRNREFIEGAYKLSQGRLSPPVLGQEAALAALAAPDSYVEGVKAEYTRRRNLLVEGLRSIEGVKCNFPLGAFYLVAELPVDDAEKFALFMLDEFSYKNATVMVAPCEDFYVTKGLGRKQVRLAYVLNSEDLKAALVCLEKGLQAYLAR